MRVGGRSAPAIRAQTSPLTRSPTADEPLLIILLTEAERSLTASVTPLTPSAIESMKESLIVADGPPPQLRGATKDSVKESANRSASPGSVPMKFEKRYRRRKKDKGTPGDGDGQVTPGPDLSA